MKIERTITIQAPPERVWSVMSDVERWPEWTASVTSVRRLDPGAFTVGSRARVLQPKLPPAVWQVTDLQPGRSFTWVAGGPGFRSAGTHSIRPSRGGSEATLILEMRGLGVVLLWPLIAGTAARYVGLEAEGLKSASEA